MKIPTLKFIFDRRGTSSPTTKGLVELRILYDRKQKVMSTGISIYPREWQDEQVVGNASAMEYNTVLLTMKRKAMKIISEMLDNGRVDINAIPTLMKQQSVNMTFLDYVFRRIEKKKKQVTEHTYRSYVTMLNKVSEFGRIKFFADITPSKIREFSEWLHAYKMHGKKKYSQATIYKITSNLSLFISDAVVDGFLSENPYITKRMNENKGGTRIDQYLLPGEVEKIENARMPTPAVEKSRDLFLLQCYTGMAYIDIMTYNFKKLKVTDEQLCRGKRHKTGVEFVFYLTPKARSILERYRYILPPISNQKYNAHLKIVADAAGIDKPITSHMGRRTAGSIWLNMGISIDVVAKCLGHQSVQVTQRAYAKILDTTVMDAFKAHQKRQEG